MSLVGSLEDLGLGDILQIISLSRKSGVLLLRSEHGEGQILFRDGRVNGAVCKGGPADLRSLLVGAGILDDATFAAAARTAHSDGRDLVAVLCELAGFDRPRLDGVRQQHIEQAAFTMFSWPTGEFSFEVREDLDSVDPGLCLEGGIDAQYLAMEGARLRDEEHRPEPLPDPSDPSSFADLGAELRDDPEEVALAEAVVEPEPDLLEAVAEPLPAPVSARPVLEPVEEAVTELVAEPAEEARESPFDAAEEATESPFDAAEAVALASVERHDPRPDVEPEGIDEGVLEGEIELEATPLEGEAESDAEDAVELAEDAAPRSQVPVVVVDPELAVLEWAKRVLSLSYARVHIFQKTELAIARIRQYLVRHETPVVLLSEKAPPDPNSGAQEASEIAARLRAQAPRMSIAILSGRASELSLEEIAVVRARPERGDLYNPRRAPLLEELGEILRAAAAPEPEASAAPRGGSDLRRLREVSAELREAAANGQIIPVVLRFASEHFSRVAMFMVRDELAVGMAGVGLQAAGGPDDAGLREIALRADAPAWFRTVAAAGGAVRGGPSDEGDRLLLKLLGDVTPDEAYVAPLESGGGVAAFLYADNLPGGGPLGDTQGLEVVLHEAGLALDRATLERQLAEAEGA